MEKIGFRAPGFQGCFHRWGGYGLIEKAERWLIGLKLRCTSFDPAFEVQRESSGRCLVLLLPVEIRSKIAAIAASLNKRSSPPDRTDAHDQPAVGVDRCRMSALVVRTVHQ
jgi:hypothetical protein